MKRFLALLLLLMALMWVNEAFAALSKKGPFFLVVKTMTAAEAAALVTATGKPIHYVNTDDGLAHYVTALGVDYTLTETGTVGGSGNSWWGSDTSGTLATGQTVYIVGNSGVSVSLATSGVSPVVFYVGVDTDVILTHAGLTTYYGPNDDVNLNSVSTYGVSVWGTGSAPFATILPDTGVSSAEIGGPNHIYFQIDGTNYVLLETAYLRNASGGWALMNETASATNPTLTPSDGDADTGIGSAGANILSMIGGGVQGIANDQNGVTVYWSDGIPAIRVDSGTSQVHIYDSTGVTQVTVDVNNIHGKAPLTDSALATKKYVDDNSGSVAAGVSTPGVTIYHTPTFGLTPLFINTDQDGIAGITVQATPHNAKIGIAIVNDAATWRIVNDGADGATLKFYKEGTAAITMDSTGTQSAGSFNASGNITGVSFYSYDTNGIGGLYLYTKAAGGNYVALKTPGDGLLSGDYTLTLPVTSGTSGQAILTDNSGNLTFGNPTTVEADATALTALNAHTGASVVGGVSTSPNMVAVAPGAAWTQSDNDSTGNTVFITLPYTMVMTGVSLWKSSTATLGVSVWVVTAGTALPDFNNASQRLVDISDNGNNTANVSGSTRITAGSILALKPNTISNGVSAYTVQIIGRKE